MSLPLQVKKSSKMKDTLAELPGFSEKKSSTRRKSHSFSYPKGYDVSSSTFSNATDSSESISQDQMSGMIRNLYPEQDYKEILKKLNDEGELFEDPYFTPCNNMLTKYSGGQNPYHSSNIQWIRPHVNLEEKN